jgi:hypothetical protein
MYTAFFRTFYLIFAALFVMLFLATAAIVVRAAQFGDYPSTIVGVGVAALCAMLINRAVGYMRE